MPTYRSATVLAVLVAQIAIEATVFAAVSPSTHPQFRSGWKRVHGTVDRTRLAGGLDEVVLGEVDDLHVLLIEEIGASSLRADGTYQIDFRRAAWDGHRMSDGDPDNGWLPDLVVCMRANGLLIPLTAVRENVPPHALARDHGGLRIDVDDSPRADTGYRPSADGLRFPNSYRLDLLGVPTGSFGLSGGIARLALDHFCDGSSPPRNTATPRSGSLFDAVYARQRELMLQDGWLRVAAWQSLPLYDDRTRLPRSSLLLRTNAQFEVLSGLLRQAEPALLTVIRRGPEPFRRHDEIALARPGDNAQVLAYRFESDHGVAHVWIDDPAFATDPNRDRVRIVFRRTRTSGSTPQMEQQVLDADGAVVTTLPVRGFYVTFAHSRPELPRGLEPLFATVDRRLGRTVRVRGDFDGDGLEDHVHLREHDWTFELLCSDGDSMRTASELPLEADRATDVVAAVGRFAATDRRALLVYDRHDHDWTRLGWDRTSGSLATSTSASSWFASGLGDRHLVGDFDGDGLDEVLVVHRIGIGLGWLVEGDGARPTHRTVSLPSGLCVASATMAACDVDGDGADEVVYHDGAAERWSTLHLLSSSATFLAVDYQSDASGFARLDADEISCIVDLDGDGRASLVVHRPHDGSWHRGDFDASTSPPRVEWPRIHDGQPLGSLDPERSELLPCDVDGDGREEIVIAVRPTSEWWLLDAPPNGSATLSRLDVTPERTAMLQDAVFLTGRYLHADRDAVGYLDPPTGAIHVAAVASGGLHWRALHAPHSAAVRYLAAACGRAFDKPTLAVTGEPIPDFTLRMQVVQNGLPRPAFVFGAARAIVPISPVCALSIRADVIEAGNADSGYAMEFTVPATPALLGSVAHVQAVLLDPQAVAGLSITQGATFEVGAWPRPARPFRATLSDPETGSTRTTTRTTVDLAVTPVLHRRAPFEIRYSNDAGRSWSRWRAYGNGPIPVDLTAHGGSATPGLREVLLLIRDDTGLVAEARAAITLR